MNKLSDILRIPGVMALGEFSEEGELVGFQAQDGFSLPEDAACKVAAACAKAQQAMLELGEEMGDATGEPWLPPVGWMYAGGMFTVAVSNGFGVFVDTSTVDFNDLFSGLVGAR